MAAQKTAIDDVDSKKQLVTDLLVGIFFAGLGGAVGGAIAGGLKCAVEEAFVKAAASGAILDATKDVVKFTTRFVEQFGGSPGDPTSVSGDLGGSGVELARDVGQKPSTPRAMRYSARSRSWSRLVRDNPEACDNGEDLRVEGDPAAVIGADPFLKVLGSIASASKQSFAKLLWATWIDEHAYSIDEQCNEWADCRAVVEDDVEDFFGWWADLTQNIEAQAGADFGLRVRLDAARAKVQEKVEARNRENFFAG